MYKQIYLLDRDHIVENSDYAEITVLSDDFVCILNKFDQWVRGNKFES